MASIVLTGVTGQIGGLVAAHLSANRVAFATAGRDPERAAQRAPGASAWRHADFESPLTLVNAFEGATTVLLVCGDHPKQDVLETQAIHAAKAAGVHHIVKVSAQSAGWQPPASVGVFHQRSEQALVASGMLWSIVRPVFFQQTLLGFAGAVAHTGKIILPAGTGACAFVDARDVAEVCAACLTDAQHAGKILTLTGPHAHTFGQVTELIGSAISKPVGYLDIPPELARLELPKATGMPPWLSDLVVDLLVGIGQGKQAAVNDEVRTVLGREARSLIAFIHEHAAAFSG